MKRPLGAGLELDDDPNRVDIDAVHAFVSTESYWGLGRPRDLVERLIRNSTRVAGLYDGAKQVGFARAVSDGAIIAYLADVYVLPDYRGRGLGAELVRFAIEEAPFSGARWLLHTADAHSLYAKFGFAPPSDRVMERPRRE